MALLLTHVWKAIHIGYPIWMVWAIRQAQIASKGGEGEEKDEHK